MHRSKNHTHSITSLARSSTDVGSSMPSALALLRLTTRSNFTARSTGGSAGEVPFKILSTKAAERANRSRRSTPYSISAPASACGLNPISKPQCSATVTISS
jgi:hypothetical protein